MLEDWWQRSSRTVHHHGEVIIMVLIYSHHEKNIISLTPISKPKVEELDGTSQNEEQVL